MISIIDALQCVGVVVLSVLVYWLILAVAQLIKDVNKINEHN